MPQSEYETTAYACYEELKAKRQVYLDRAQAAAAVTIPAMYPQSGNFDFAATDTSTQSLLHPMQSEGARAINTLASKLALVLLPPGFSYLRIRFDPTTKIKLSPQEQAVLGTNKPFMQLADSPQLLNLFDEKVAIFEGTVMSEIEEKQTRIQVEGAIRHLIVSGNVIFYQDPETGYCRHFRLDQYVTLRDASGNLRKAVICEKLAYEVLTPAMQDLCRPKENGKDYENLEDIELYTYIGRVSDNDARIDTAKYEVYQEIHGEIVDGSEKTFTHESLPYWVLTFVLEPGEHYGRGRIEEYFGAFNQNEGLTQNLSSIAAVMAGVKFLVDPGGMTMIDDLANSPHMAYVPGRLKDVEPTKGPDPGSFTAVGAWLQDIRRSIQRDFMIFDTTEITRDRLTAEEVRRLGQEVDMGHGGLHTNLRGNLGTKIILGTVNRLRRENRFVDVDFETDGQLKESINFSVLTGIEALGRGNEEERMMRWATTIAQTYGPEVLKLITDPREFAGRLGSASGISTHGMLLSRERIQQNLQMAQQAQMEQTIGPEVVRQGGQILQSQIPEQQAAQ